MIEISELKKKKKDMQIQYVLERRNYIRAAQSAKRWIEKNTIAGDGIVITSKQRKIYQEVTGYFIPTLLQWGMRDRAINYAKYLCSAQQRSGAWLSSDMRHESVFNTGQVLRGLVAIYNVMPEVKVNIIRACDWLLSNAREDGRLSSVEGTDWPANGMNSELIHLYCLPPLVEAGKLLEIDRYVNSAKKIKTYYLKHYKRDIDEFNYLSHFYAYVLEALFDLGEIGIVKNAMNKLARKQRGDGSVPAYKNVQWICSTGLFQLSIIWFKLGDKIHGEKAFNYAVSLQNKPSGGWYGGYAWPSNTSFIATIIHERQEVDYFPQEEISWAVKYFFDALYYRQLLEYRIRAHTFLAQLDSTDSRFKIVDECVIKAAQDGSIIQVADVGCGKGRYLKKLLLRHPENKYYGMDLSEEVLRYINNPRIEIGTGSILYMPYYDGSFHVILAAEAVEHAIFVKEAVCEMVRVLKPGGFFIVIDKDQDFFDRYKYADWFEPEELSTKQWIKTDEMVKIMKECGLVDIRTEIIPSIEGSWYRYYIGVKNE